MFETCVGMKFVDDDNDDDNDDSKAKLQDRPTDTIYATNKETEKSKVQTILYFTYTNGICMYE